jgi:quinol monooxygenase YgiN
MILEMADIRIRPGEQVAFDAAIRRGVETVIAKATGFRGYKVNRGVESPDRYVPPQIEHFTLVAKSHAP